MAEVSHAFAKVGTNYQELIEKIARTTAEFVGDGCMVTLLDVKKETLANAASAHRDPVLEKDYKDYLANTALSLSESNAVSAQVARTGIPKIADVDPESLVAQTDDALKPIVKRLNVHSYAVLAIRVRDSVIGTLSLMRSTPGRSYTPDDVALLQDLADRAGLAIENARLYDDLERRVKERTAELNELNKELESFNYSIAHDLRAPLRSISGFSKVLLEDHAEQINADGQGFLKRIVDAVMCMNQLVEDLLSLSKVSKSAPTREQVNLSTLAQSVMAKLQENEPDRKVTFVMAENVVATCDPRLLDVVLTNLLGNAFKFTRNCKNAQIEFAVKVAGQKSTFLIRDNGAGFDAKYSEKLFVAFQRLHKVSEFEGTGIGLATVRRIINRHGGRAWAEGEVGRGATFYFTLES